jgi:chromatin remodeling complex protein RSC6
MATAKKAGKKTAAKKPAAKKSAAKKPAAKKSATKKAAAPKKAAAKKPAAPIMEGGGGDRDLHCMAHTRPTPRPADVVGTSPMPRTEVTKKIWDYIKKNKLQDGVNKRLINADDKLRAVFGGKNKVSMFEMTKLVSNHLK